MLRTRATLAIIRSKKTRQLRKLLNSTTPTSRQQNQGIVQQLHKTFGPVESRGWVLNDGSYFRQIAKLWKRRFDVPELSRVHAGSFNRRMERAKRRLLKWEKDFWTIPDPEIDAWMLVMGRTRAVFDLEAFITKYCKYIECLSRIRRIVNVRVMADRCPMQKILSQTNREEVDGEQRNIQLNSQAFITAIRKWVCITLDLVV